MLGLNLPIRPFVSPLASNADGKVLPAADFEVKETPRLDPVTFWLNGNPFDWKSGDVTSRTAYVSSALAYICIRYRATKFMEAPPIVIREVGEGEENIPNHPLLSLLRRPNPDYGMRRLLAKTSINLDITGRAAWLISRDRMGRPARLYAFSGDDFITKPAGGMLFGQFTFSTSDGPLTIGPDRRSDVVMFQFDDPRDEQRALAPLEPALAHLNLSQELAHRVKYMLRNAAAPSGVFTIPKDRHLKDDEHRRIKEEINLKYNGTESGKVMVLEGGGTFERTSMTLKELALGDLWRENEAVVCAAFGVPAALVGVVVGLENSPWSHIASAKKSLYEDIIIPLWGDIAEAMTLQLLEPIDDDPTHRIVFDRTRVEGLRSVNAVINAQVAAQNARIWSLNERRLYTDQARSDDPRANDIPELVNPSGAALPSPPTPGNDTTDEGETIRSTNGKNGRPTVTALLNGNGNGEHEN